MISFLRGIPRTLQTGAAFLRRVPALNPVQSSIRPVLVHSRSIHFGPTPLNGVDHRKDITKPAAPPNQWFGEAHSLSEIYKFLDRLTGCSRNVYNITFGFRGNKVRVIKVGARRFGNHRAVVLLSGHHAYEWTGVAVGLYVASNFARSPFDDVDVFIVPTVNPIQYDLHHQAKSTLSSVYTPSAFNVPLPLGFLSPETDILANGPIKNLVDRLGKRFIRIVQDLETGTIRQNSQGQGNVHNSAGLNFNPPFGSFSNCPTLGAMGENCVMMGPSPSYIIELRDKDKMLKEDQIVSRGEEIVAGIRHLVGQGNSM